MATKSNRLRSVLMSAAAVSICAGGGAFAQTTPSRRSVDAEEVVVTATRQAEVLSKVPISVAAITNQQMEDRGIKEFADTIRFTPGIKLNGNPDSGNTIAIRGIASTAGASTTGVYLDDVPIQVRQVGYTAGTLFPSLFDIDRVEVLRGPQGTLFGSGSEGGTVRFIQPAPSFDTVTGHARLEGNNITNGGFGYEGGVAYGGPIDEHLAYRVSVNFKHDAGWIDRVTGQAFVVDPTAKSGPASYGFNQTGVYGKNSNWRDTAGIRGAIAYKPTEDLTITLSANYSYTYVHDNIGSVWAPITNADAGVFQTPVFIAGPADALHVAETAPNLNKGHNNMFVPYLNVDWTNGDIEIISTTAYLNHRHLTWNDVTTGYLFPYLGAPVPRPGDKGYDLLTDQSENYSQEIRVQSLDQDSPWHWVAGLFYSKDYQRSYEVEGDNFLQLAPRFFGVGAGDDPFPGTSAFLNNFGAPSLANGATYVSLSRANEAQLAGFAQVDYKVLPGVTLTAGGRLSQNMLSVFTTQDGPENNLNGPYGASCPLAGGCTPGQDPFAPVYATANLKDNEVVFTPKFGVSWQMDDANLLYGTISRGFRPGGAQVRLPAACDAQLVAFGFKDSNGNAVSPTSYHSDTVWSYELGSKNSFLDGAVSMDSSAYIIHWNKIQTNINLPDCGYATVANEGAATSQGFDAAISARPAPGLSVSAAFGYNQTRFDATTPAFVKGQTVPGTGSPYTVVLSGEYGRPIDEYEPYIRGDYTWQSRPYSVGSYLRGSPSYDPLSVAPAAQGLLGVRVGLRVETWDVSLFANNLLNFNSPNSIDHVRHSSLYTESFVLPRTIGITISDRF
jgi:iron complex outermembrane receptor protein